MTILKHHQGQDAEQICSFDVTNPTFEKEILSELIAYEEEDTGIEENDEPLPEFQPFGDDPEGPNLHVEEETEIINIGTAEDIKQVHISTKLSPKPGKSSLHSSRNMQTSSLGAMMIWLA